MLRAVGWGVSAVVIIVVGLVSVLRRRDHDPAGAAGLVEPVTAGGGDPGATPDDGGAR